jgi:hypothetical protein
VLGTGQCGGVSGFLCESVGARKDKTSIARWLLAFTMWAFDQGADNQCHDSRSTHLRVTLDDTRRNRKPLQIMIKLEANFLLTSTS